MQEGVKNQKHKDEYKTAVTEKEFRAFFKDLETQMTRYKFWQVYWNANRGDIDNDTWGLVMRGITGGKGGWPGRAGFQGKVWTCDNFQLIRQIDLR
jgi:hypothetical protein